MICILALSAAIATAALAAHAAGHAHAPVKTSVQGYLTDGHDMTLYAFDKDSDGHSACYDKCALTWPPLALEDGAKLPEGFDLIKRNDGTEQIAYKGQPLYLWVKDTAPGQTTGDGVKGVWHIAKP